MMEKFAKFDIWEDRAKILIGIENPSPKTNSRQKVDIFSIHHQPVLVQWVISFNYLPCCRSALIFWVKDFWEFVQSVFAIFFTSDFFLQYDFIIFLQSDCPIFLVQGFWEFVQSDLAEHPALFFSSASTAKQRVNMNFVLRSVSGFHALAWTLLETLSRGHNISRWSLSGDAKSYRRLRPSHFLKRFFFFWCWCQTRKKRKYIHYCTCTAEKN